MPSKKVNPENSIVFSNDGAWCWFQDPRSVHINGKNRRTFAQWITHDGKLSAGFYDHDTKDKEEYIIKQKWDVDDHNVGAFLVLEDNRIMMFYARHNKKGLFMRITKNPEDISSWEDEIIITNKKRITYAHPLYLKNEKKFFVFWRASSWKPTYSTSKDGITWSDSKIIVQGIGKESNRVRPYTKVFSNNLDTIHITFTDGHPRDESRNSVYYMKYQNGKFLKADNSPIHHSNSSFIQERPIRPRECDIVFDGKIHGYRGWVWDITEDEQQNPQILYTQLPSNKNHYYHLAKWNGEGWTDERLIMGGGWFPETKRWKRESEPHYSGGLCFDHCDPNILYLSRQIKRVFEIEKWKRNKGNKGWEKTSITRNSIENNVRPVVPRFSSNEVNSKNIVLYMSGKYIHYTNFNTRIMMHKE